MLTGSCRVTRLCSQQQPGLHRPKKGNMSFGLIYWVLMLIWLVFGVWSSWPNQKMVGGNVLLFVLLLLVGWKVFGAPIHS